ncbi:hypothetical protein PCYB_021090 [Plasmodium cynomolgi strain B]|uniref:Pv-fam-d protein n=1 Tax=Plasmodium cynomolgi (strain B) TaxID=1120755 RepID=K6URQ5_PLACD|nr:hypothetical protein PCYB_021090 [Plasmodium cynomolgi strain B]GAB64540.1 hypothetical protein PCYB_021090 [Plasmodium cynomolgi strain B]
MGETTNRFLFLFYKFFTLALFIWTWKYSDKSVLDSSTVKKRAQNVSSLSGRPNRLLCKGPTAIAKDESENKKLKDRVIKVLNEDESSLGKMLNNLVHDANFQKEFNSLLLDKGFEKQFNELVSDTSSEGNQSSSLHSLSTYDGGDLTPIGFADYPEPFNSTTGSQILETDFSSQSYDENLKKTFHSTISTQEIPQALNQESKRFGSVEQLIDEIKKVDNVEKMIEILKFYENMEALVKLAEKTAATQQVPENSEIKEQVQSELESATQAELESQLQAQLHAQLQTQVKQAPPRKKIIKGKSVFGRIKKMFKKLDKKYEDHLQKLLTTNYSFLIKNGKMARSKYYLDILLAFSPLIFGGIVLSIFIHYFSYSTILPASVFALSSLFYFLFKLWNCKRICKGPGRFKFRQKYKDVINVLKK